MKAIWWHIGILSLVGTSNAAAQECEVQSAQKLVASDGADFDFFGGTVALDADRAVIGAGNAFQGFGGAEAAYVFESSAGVWSEMTILTASDSSSNDFGRAVAISGDTTIVGAKLDDANGTDAGAAYVFEFDGSNWNETKLLAPDGSIQDEFGRSVATAGDFAFIGAPRSGFAGAVYIFERTSGTWGTPVKITPNTPSSDEQFGSSVAIQGDVAIIGAIEHENGAGDAVGSVEIYRLNGANQWVFEAELVASDGADLDAFGSSVTIDGDVAVVGAHRVDTGNSDDEGAIYVFRFNGSAWIEEAKIQSPDVVEGDEFGISVSVDGDSVVAGAWKNGPSNRGAAYGFSYDTASQSWSSGVKLNPGDAVNGSQMGGDVAICGTTVFVSAELDDGDGISDFEGSIHVVGVSLEDCDGNAVSDVCDIAAGTHADCNANAVPDECDIASGESEDCNVDGVPDECPFPLELDCNLNGIPDECDISNGTSIDCDADGVPDECSVPQVMDIIFIIDGSMSVGDLNIQKQAVRDCICGGPAGNDPLPANGTIRIAVIQFSATQMVEIPLQTFSSEQERDDLCADIDAIVQDSQSTFIGPALIEAINIFNGIPDPALRRRVLISSDGGFFDDDDALDLSDDLRNLSPPARICTGFTFPDPSLCDEPHTPNELLNDMANTPSATLYDPSEPTGFYTCFLDSPAYTPMCQDCLDLPAGAADCNGNGVPDVCDPDCNMNGKPDECDIADGTSMDVDGNGIPDECVCLGDVNGDTNVNVNDLLLLLGAWGPCPAPPAECPADFDQTGDVGITDLLTLLGNWGDACTPSGLGPPQTVQDCLNRFPVGSMALDKCLEAVQ